MIITKNSNPVKIKIRILLVIYNFMYDNNLKIMDITDINALKSKFLNLKIKF